MSLSENSRDEVRGEPGRGSANSAIPEKRPMITPAHYQRHQDTPAELSCTGTWAPAWPCLHQLTRSTSEPSVFVVHSSPYSEPDHQTRKSHIGTTHEETQNPGRPYTSKLGPPKSYATGTSHEIEIVSDAGEQQSLRQRAHAYEPDNTDSHFDLEDSLHSIADQSLLFELQSNIYRAFVPTRHNDQSMPDSEFLPNGELCRVINTDSVARELAKSLLSHTQDQIHAFADTVCKEKEVKRKGRKALRTFRKVFALLVMVDMSACIPHFIEEDVSDLDLPLVPVKKNGWMELYRRDSAGKPFSKPLRCFQHLMWSIAKLRHFEKDQWILLAPFFAQGEHGEIKHYILRDQHILPFVASDETDDEETEHFGGFGKVTMARIHAEHHNFQDKVLCDRGFAVKQLYENDPGSFWKEVHILKKFSGPKSHNHVVSLLATYEHRKKYHFIFYRAEGDLFKLWKKFRPHPALTYCNVLWVAQQCAGIADGLLRLHKHLTMTLRHGSSDDGPFKPISPLSHVRSDTMEENGVRVRPGSPTWIRDRSHPPGIERPILPERFTDAVTVPKEQYGRHGDINPNNILWYCSEPYDSDNLRGTLKIADLGQAELNSLRSKTGPKSVANTMTYRPPECDTQPRIIRQSYDIWCLGCVYLEFVTWLLGGKELLTTFGEARRAPDVFQNNDETDTFFEFVTVPGATVFEVRIKPVVTKFIDRLHRHPNCTDYLHKLLLMIQNDMLVVETQKRGQSRDRMTCERVCCTLATMYQDCLKNKDYAAKATPWGESRLTADPLPQSVKVDMTEEARRTIAERLATPETRSLQLPKRATNLCE